MSRSSSSTMTTRRRGSIQSSLTASSSAPKKQQQRQSNKGIVCPFDDARFIAFLERSRYEAFHDPYRGIFPFFKLCYNNNNNDGDDEGKSSEEEIVSPWMKCSRALVAAEWTFHSHNEQKKNIVNLVDNDGSELEDNLPATMMTVVECACPTVNEWTQIQLAAAMKRQAAALKKMKKKKQQNRNKGKKKAVVLLDDDDENENDEQHNENNGIQSSDLSLEDTIIICGSRVVQGSTECNHDCACDYNPFCLASLGGILDEYRYNLAHARLHNMSEGMDNISAFMRENWTTAETASWNNNASNKKSQKKKEPMNIRDVIHVDRDCIYTHLLQRVCFATADNNSQENTASVESCMDMIEKHHRHLILPSLLPMMPSNNNNGINNNENISNNISATSQLQLSKPPGLRNLGSTCYLNSQLQCLAQNIGFVNGLFSWKPINNIHSNDNSTSSSTSNSSVARMNHVLSSMQSILARMRIGGECIIDTNEFALALGLDDDEMQDPNEFAGLLFDRMQDSFRQCAITSGQTELNNLLPSIYWGKSSITTTCCECKCSSKKIDDFKFLALPIVEGREENQPSSSDNKVKRGSTSNNKNVDVQQLLNLTLFPESLEGDNQYFCSVCNKKCNATRTPHFENIPPVLNLQLNRYIFNMETYTKQKLTTKVCLPHALDVPYLEEGESKTKTYVLVAVQNHLGNSAHGGHYVADVMDWSTGVWFEFNDEDVVVLKDGPVAGFHVDQMHGIMQSNNDKPQKINGGADAYNLFYVEKDYLSTSVKSDMLCCDRGDSSSTRSHDIETAETETDTYQLYSQMRMDMYRLEQDEQAKISRQQSRLDFRREQLIKEVFCATSQQNKLFGLSQSNGGNVLVDSTILKRFFSCTDSLEDVFKETLSTESTLNKERLLCEHKSGGVHPTTAAKLKLLPLELFDVICKILDEEYAMFMTHEATNENPPFNIRDLMFKEDELVCKDCGVSHQNKLKEKFIMLENLMTVYRELRLESNDLGNTHNLTDAYAISKRFVTSYYKYVDGAVKTLFSTNAEQMPPGGDLRCLDFSSLIEASNGEAADIKLSAGSEVLDATVNSMITCQHDKCNVMHNQRTTRIIPKSLWTKIIHIFPNAIRHAFQPPTDECIGNCSECFDEKESEERFPIQIKEWKSNVESNSTLMKILRNEYVPTVNTTPLNILHHKIVEGWRQACSYLLRSKKNVSNETVKEKLHQLLCSSSCSLCCSHQKTIGIPAFTGDNKQTLCSLKEANLEFFSKKDCADLLSSLAALENISKGKTSYSDTSYQTKLPLVTMAKEDDDIVLVLVEPEICDEGCVMLEEESVKPEKELVNDEPMDVVELDATPKQEDDMFNLCVHEVEGDVDLEVAVSTIFADLTSESEEANPRPRRSRRKKTDGEFPSHSVLVPSDCNLAHLRLLIHEKTGKRLHQQSLYYARENASSHGESSVIELLEKDNSEDFKNFVSDANPQSIYHILMTYKHPDISNELDNGSKRTRKRLGKVDMEVEDNIMSALTELAFRGKVDDNYTVRGRKVKRQKEERGFRGTFLHSSLSSVCVENGLSVNGSANS